jgi:hypothetical protein
MGRIVINVLCAIISLVALLIAAWVLISGQINRQGLDSLFLVIVCLLLVAIFLPTPVQAVRKGLLGDLRKHRKSKSTVEPAPQPAVAQQKSEQSS